MVFEEKYSEHGNYGAATVLLQNRDLDEAWNCIRYALEIDPSSVHAWCNKGVYYLKSSPPQESEAKLARDKMEELLQQDEAKKTAAIEYAYWRYDIIRKAQAKEEALELFDRLLSNESTEPVIKHHYFYMKVLTSHAKRSIWNGNANMTTEVQRSVLQKIFEEALVLLETPDHEVAVWHSLSLVLLDKTCLDLVRKGFDEVKFLKQKYKLRTIDSMLSVEKILEIFKENPNLMDPRHQVFATIGKVYLEKAQKTDNYTERWKLLKTTSPCFGSQVSSDILMQMWAMKYSEAEPEKAWNAHREIFGNQGTR